jgi:hypothetical protein
MAADLPRNRLGLARWMFTRENPLTARVAVNRMWQEIFGTGLGQDRRRLWQPGRAALPIRNCSTGSAVDFRESGWDVKRFYRQILTSAATASLALATPPNSPRTQRIADQPRPALPHGWRNDPRLRSAAAGCSPRRSADRALAPTSPRAFGRRGDVRFQYPLLKRDAGEGLYRRSLYTFWKRSAPPASMDIFNAPTRESCTVRRERTDTPLQALSP